MIKPQKADLIMIRGQSLISQTIEQLSNSPYSHSAIVVKNNELIEANGFRKTGYQALHYYKGSGDIYTCDQLSNEDRIQIAKYLQKQIGTRYDYKLLFWEFIRLGLGLVLPYKNTQSVICSELARDAFLYGAEIDLTPNIKYPTPDEISKSFKLRYVGSL